MLTLAAYRTKVLELLNDPTPDRFTTALVHEALLSALELYSQFNPLQRLYYFDSTGLRRETLPADFQAQAVRRIEWISGSDYTFACDLAFYAYRVDEQWVFEPRDVLIPAGEVLSIHYDTYHTIDGLNGEAGTTIPPADTQLLAIGAAGQACRMRATGQAETNNLNPAETQALLEASARWLAEFELRLGDPQMGFQSASWHDASMDRNY